MEEEKKTEETSIEQSKEVKEEKVILPLEEGDPEDEGYHFPWTFVVIGGVIVVLMVVCIIVIACNGGFHA